MLAQTKQTGNNVSTVNPNSVVNVGTIKLGAPPPNPSAPKQPEPTIPTGGSTIQIQGQVTPVPAIPAAPKAAPTTVKVIAPAPKPKP